MEKRKKEIMELALNGGETGAIIINLINDGELDHIIAKISDKKTKTFKNDITPKGYLNGNEQFYDVLREFVGTFLSEFAPLTHKSIHIANVLRNVEPKFLLCKNYWGDNNFIDYYRFNIRQLLVTNFYNNLMLLYREGKINRFCNYLKIKPRLSLKKEEDVNYLYDLLKEMVWCSYNDYSNYVLFDDYNNYVEACSLKCKADKDDIEKSLFNHYEMHLGNIIDNYYERISSVKEFFSPKETDIKVEENMISYYDLLTLIKEEKNPKKVYLNLFKKKVMYVFDEENGYIINNKNKRDENFDYYLIDCFTDIGVFKKNISIII